MTEDPLQPGAVLSKLLAEKGWTQSDLANVLGKTAATVNGIIHGKRTITPELAVALGSALDTEAAFWLTLESQRQLGFLPAADEAIRRRAECFEIAPVKELQRRGWIKTTAATDDLVAELQRFYGQDDLSQPPRFTVSARTSKKDLAHDLTPLQMAWCYRARQIAASLLSPVFDPDKFNQCEKELRTLAAFKPNTGKVPSTLAFYGIRYAVVEPLQGSAIDGAAFWLDENVPVIAMSLRFDRIDNFWFTLFHELSHIRHRDAISVDTDLSGPETSFAAEKPPHERRADNEAAQSLVKPATLQSFINRVGPMYSRDRIVRFAHRIKMHPGVIVGQLQHRGEIGFHTHKEFLVKIREIVTSTATTDGWGTSISDSSLA